MEIGLLAAAACGAGLQNLFQGGGGAKSGTVCGFERSRAGWRMPASLCSSELREGVTNTGLLVTRLAWMAFGEISSQLFKYIYPKVSLQSQPQRVFWEHWPAKILAVVPVGEGWGQLSSQLLRSIHCMEYNIYGISAFYFLFLFFTLPTYLCLPDLQGDPQVDLFERKSVGEPT